MSTSSEEKATSTEQAAPTPPAGDEPETGQPRRQGLAIASVSVGAVGMVIAVGTWATWLAVRPSVTLITSEVSFVGAIFAMALGLFWFAALAVGVLGMVFGLVAGARGPGGGDLARVGTMFSMITAALAVAGAVVFVFAMARGIEPPRGPIAYPLPYVG